MYTGRMTGTVALHVNVDKMLEPRRETFTAQVRALLVVDSLTSDSDER